MINLPLNLESRSRSLWSANWRNGGNQNIAERNKARDRKKTKMHLRPISVRILLPHQQAKWTSAFCGEVSEPALEGKPWSPSVFPIEKSENGEVGQGPWPLSSTRPILWDDNKLANLRLWMRMTMYSTSASDNFPLWKLSNKFRVPSWRRCCKWHPTLEWCWFICFFFFFNISKVM